jgi:D-alanyl-D-alanine carboxypeptidase
MKLDRSNWVNIASIFIIAISVSSWFFLLPKLFSQTESSELDASAEVVVAGENSFIKDKFSQTGISENSKAVFRKKEQASTAEVFKVTRTEPPIRKKDVNDIYVRAHASILIDADTGQVLYAQQPDKRLAIASLTKIMTAIVVVENVENLNELATIDKEVLNVEGTIVGCPSTGYCVANRLELGEKVRVRNLLEVMLMNSANDAAVALGRHIAGTEEKFAEMMNEKAKELGLKNTNFCNPSGLDDDDNPGACYSTARDYAKIVAYSMHEHQLIWDILQTQEKLFTSADGKILHKSATTHSLLNQMPNCLGGKTGFTYEAGKTLMSTAHHPQDENIRLIGVILNNPYRWDDMRSMLEWGFSAYDWGI